MGRQRESSPFEMPIVGLDQRFQGLENLHDSDRGDDLFEEGSSLSFGPRHASSGFGRERSRADEAERTRTGDDQLNLAGRNEDGRYLHDG